MSRMRGSGFVAVVFAIVVLPAQAQAGFFDQFFGAQPQPYYGYPPAFEPPGSAAVRHRSHRPKAAAVDEKPIRQTPTDLMHDATLRYGDAVMTESGVTIFTGERAASHDLDEFSPLQDVKHMRLKDKMALAAAVDGTKAGGLVSGRSSTVTTPIAKGVIINDPSGRSIRYVGP